MLWLYSGVTTMKASACFTPLIPVLVAPPGSSRFTSMPVPARSAAMMWDSASVAARDGP